MILGFEKLKSNYILCNFVYGKNIRFSENYLKNIITEKSESLCILYIIFKVIRFTVIFRFTEL